MKSTESFAPIEINIGNPMDPKWPERDSTMERWRKSDQVMVNHWPGNNPWTTVRVRSETFGEPSKVFPSEEMIAKVFMTLEFVKPTMYDPAVTGRFRGKRWANPND